MKTYLRLLLHCAMALLLLQQKVRGQVQGCQRVVPMRYSYRAGALENTDVDNNCQENSASEVTCQHPGVLTDSELGPAQFDADDSEAYYHWNKRMENQILFTFGTDVSISMFCLNFYSSRDNGIALPKTRLSLVDRNFTASDTLDESTTSSFTTGEDFGQSGMNVLTNISRVLSLAFRNRTTQILLRIEGDKTYALALSEIKFCTEAALSTTTGTTAALPSPSTSEQSAQPPTELTELTEPTEEQTQASATANSQSTTETRTSGTPTSIVTVSGGQPPLHTLSLSLLVSMLFVLLVL